MVQLLVSVRNSREARDAVAAGARLIDIKEPQKGPLGATDPTTWQEIRRAIPAGFPVSAALGELLHCRAEDDWSPLNGLDYAKVGLAGCRPFHDWPARWCRLMERLPASVTRVAVAYADSVSSESPLPEDVIDVGRNLGCRAFLLDTCNKSHGKLFDHLKPSVVRSHVERAHMAGLIVVLAGSLDGESLATAASLGPDYVAVRGAACRGGRDKDLDRSLVLACVERLAPSTTHPRNSDASSERHSKLAGSALAASGRPPL